MPSRSRVVGSRWPAGEAVLQVIGSGPSGEYAEPNDEEFAEALYGSIADGGRSFLGAVIAELRGADHEPNAEEVREACAAVLRAQNRLDGTKTPEVPPPFALVESLLAEA
jgi:hypothetical protein